MAVTRTMRVAGVAVAAAVAVVASTAPVSATSVNTDGDSKTYTAPTCSVDGDYVVNVYDGSSKLLAYPGNESKMGPFDAQVPAGTYKLNIHSYDNHSEQGNWNQLEEMWYIQALNANGDVIYTSPWTQDVPENVDEITHELDEATFGEDVARVMLRHAYNTNSFDKPESVIPVCVAFEAVAVPTPTPSPTPEVEDEPQVLAETTETPSVLPNTGGLVATGVASFGAAGVLNAAYRRFRSRK